MNSTTVTAVPITPPTGIEAKEASRLTAFVTAAVNAVALGFSAWGITYKADLPHLITVLIIALVTFVGAVVPIAQGEITRGKVYSAASVAKIAAAVVAAAPPVIAAGEAVVKDVAPAAPAAAPDGAPAYPVAAQPATV